ncbi:MAG TPA: SpoIIE family protein phosphatase [Pirellulales bacterium]|nr:SpoIIE family protein phosphatase [Pirellulales bacterium]
MQSITGDNAGERHTLNGPKAILGRHPDCQIVLDSGAVSRQHAEITCTDGDFFIQDLGSRNGTIVNGQAIQARHRLQDGDRLKICDLSFAFYRDQPSDRAPVPGIAPLADAMLIDDADEHTGKSTIMSKLDISSGTAGVRVSVNPEVKLRAVIEITENLRSALSVDSVLPKLLESLFKIFVQADRGFVVLRGANPGQLLIKAVKQRRADSEDMIRISRTIVNSVLDGKQAILSADAAADSRFEMSQSIADFRIRSMMCAPLVNSEGDALGVIQIDTIDQRARFQQDDLDVLASVANQAAFALENAQLHERSLKQREVEKELELAHKVQQSLLPSAPPILEGYCFFDFYEPANQVGGDFYDYIPLPGGRLAIVLADVSGKGVPAALVMARVSSEVRYCLASEPSVAEAVSRVNASFCKAGWDDKFVTFVLTLIDPAREEATIVNAGHMAPLLRRGSGKVVAVGEGDDDGGPPLGIDADFQYTAITHPLARGDFLTMFTDGISEAMNPDNKLYGLDRLSTQMGRAVENVSDLGREILADVKRFVSGRPQSDDMCLVCFGRE